MRFKWDEEDSEYVVTLEEGDADEDGLDSLSPDMDFLALLPEGEVDEDDSWSVSGDQLATVFLPGGMFPLPDAGDDGGELASVVEEELTSQFEQASPNSRSAAPTPAHATRTARVWARSPSSSRAKPRSTCPT